MKYPSRADIVEMRARGYDTSTIAEAERRLSRWHTAQQICRAIETAFDGVVLGNGVGLQQGRGLDDYADAATCAAYRAADEKDDWRRIPAEVLNCYHGSLSFLDAQGMRFHLPAFLLADLRDDLGMDTSSYLTHRWENFESQFSLFSREQRLAVRAYLLHIADDPDYQFNRSEIVSALDGYWAEPDMD